MTKKLLLIAITVALGFVSCYSQFQLEPAPFKKATESGTVQILDVRTPEEFTKGHIKEAFNADWNNPTVFNQRTKHLDKTKAVYVYCLAGSRSARAASQLREEGFTVYELKGGMNAWKQLQLPVEGKSDQPQMSINEYQNFIRLHAAQWVLVDFHASWCIPCKKMAPYVAKLTDESKGKIVLFKVDGNADLEVMLFNKVESVPYFILYHNGVEVWRHQGFIEEQELKKILHSQLQKKQQ